MTAQGLAVIRQLLRLRWSATSTCGTEEDRIMARSGGNAFFSNFASYDAPFATKVRLALANNWRKMRTGSSCCGNLGQPGC
jgi:hypothetical protein